MMRLLFPLAALLIAVFSILTDLYPRQPASAVCLHGGCRIDQTDAMVLAHGATPAIANALLVEDPADPGMWCAYGEFISSRGQNQKAQAAFAHALTLGSGLSPVLMRAANFDFSHDHAGEGLRLVPRILAQTGTFDEILFSYVRASATPTQQVLASVIPAEPRAAHSWLAWQLRAGTEQDLLDTWAWMRRNRLADQKSAVSVASTLWQRKAYPAAQQLWKEWTGGSSHGSELIANSQFSEAPSGTPFDWTLEAAPGVEMQREHGLVLHFLGQVNLTSVGVQQVTAVRPGAPYHFSAEVEADNLTTDQGVVFELSDAENAGRLHLETQPVLGKRPRGWVSVDFSVPGATQALRIRLLRHPSLKFDDKLAGTLHIYSVSLVPTP